MLRAFESKKKGPDRCRTFRKTAGEGPGALTLAAVLWAEPSAEGSLAMDYLSRRLEQLADQQGKQLLSLPFAGRKALCLDFIRGLDQELSYIGRAQNRTYRAGLTLLALQNSSYFCIDCEEGHAFLFSQGLLRCISGGADCTPSPFGTGEAHPFPSDGVLPAGALLLLSARTLSPPRHRGLESALAKQERDPRVLCALTEADSQEKNAILFTDEEVSP